MPWEKPANRQAKLAQALPQKQGRLAKRLVFKFEILNKFKIGNSNASSALLCGSGKSTGSARGEPAAATRQRRVLPPTEDGWNSRPYLALGLSGARLECLGDERPHVFRVKPVVAGAPLEFRVSGRT